MNNLEKTIINQTLKLLKEEPEEWAFDDYYAKHSSGLMIWTYNGMSFFKIFTGKHEVGSPIFFSFFSPWRVKMAIALIKVWFSTKEERVLLEKQKEQKDISEFLNKYKGKQQ